MKLSGKYLDAKEIHVNEGDSIQKAVNAANEGDVVVIHGGTYRERIVIDKSNISIRGAAGEVAVLKGSRVIDFWNETNDGAFEWKIPQNWEGATGFLYAGQRRFKEVRKYSELVDYSFMFSKWALPEKAEIKGILNSRIETGKSCRGEVWERLDSDAEGIVDFTEKTKALKSDSFYFLHSWVYSPKKISGSLKLGACKADQDGRWPMSLINDFHGFRRPDCPYEDAKQAAFIWVNGNRLENWGKHTPAVNGFDWEKGWNSVLVQLKYSAFKPQKWFLKACSHMWVDTAISGMRSSCSKKEKSADDISSDNKGIIIREYLTLGPFKDSAKDSIVAYLPKGMNANSSAIELSCLGSILSGSGDASSNVSIEGLTFSQSATNPKDGMLCPGAGAGDWVIKDSIFTESTGSGIDFLSSLEKISSGHKVKNCSFISNGCLGIQGWGPSFKGIKDIVIEDCRFEKNNWLDYSLGWHASSIKLCRLSNSIIRRNVFVNNNCYGIWLDWECEGNVIEENKVISAMSAGIFIEASRWGNKVVNNIVAYTKDGVFGGCGIYMHDSSDTYITNNTLLYNDGFGFKIGLATNRKLSLGVNMRRDCNVFMNNLLGFNAKGCASIPQENKSRPENIYDHNLYWGENGKTVFEMSGIQGDDDVFDAEHGVEPEIKKYKINGLNKLIKLTGQEKKSKSTQVFIDPKSLMPINDCFSSPQGTADNLCELDNGGFGAILQREGGS